MAEVKRQKTIVVGAGPVGALAALYAARRGDEVEIYELRGGKNWNVCFTIQINVDFAGRSPR